MKLRVSLGRHGRQNSRGTPLSLVWFALAKDAHEGVLWVALSMLPVLCGPQFRSNLVDRLRPKLAAKLAGDVAKTHRSETK